MNLNDPQVQAVIAVAASAAVAQYVRDNPSPQGQPGPSKSSDNRGLAESDNLSEGNNALKSDNIDYFDSTCEEEGLVVTISRYIFYKNVYAFVDRLKDFAIIKSNEKIRDALSTCFRGEALT